MRQGKSQSRETLDENNCYLPQNASYELCRVNGDTVSNLYSTRCATIEKRSGGKQFTLAHISPKVPHHVVIIRKFNPNTTFNHVPLRCRVSSAPHEKQFSFDNVGDFASNLKSTDTQVWYGNASG